MLVALRFITTLELFKLVHGGGWMFRMEQSLPQ